MGRVAIISAGALRSKGTRPAFALDRPGPNLPAQSWVPGEIGKASADTRGWSVYLRHGREGAGLTKRLFFRAPLVEGRESQP